MSNRPDNPFQNNAPGTMYGDQQPASGGGRVWLWVLGIVGGVFVLGALVCCGATFFAYRTGTGMIAEAFKQQLNGNPVIEEHIGEISSINFNLTETTSQAESSEGAMAFDIQGSKASGKLLIQPSKSGDGQEIGTAVLVLADGTRHEVPIEANDVPLESYIDDGNAMTDESGEAVGEPITDDSTPAEQVDPVLQNEPAQ